MTRRIDWVKLIYRPWARYASRRILTGRLRDRGAAERGRFTPADVDQVLASAWREYDRESPSLPQQPTRGSTMNVRLACFTRAVLNALLSRGIERAYAIELVADATWSVYRVWGAMARAIIRLVPGKSSRLALAASPRDPNRPPSLNFPFNAPGYLVERVPTEGGIGFDVVRCPVAAYFRQRGGADLCVASWCNLDYALSEITGEKLVRTRTLVQGADRCDFRILPAAGGVASP